MYERTIQFYSEIDKKRFNSIVKDQPFNITLTFGSQIVDGKSLLGLYILPENMDIKLEVYSDDFSKEELDEMLKGWFV